MVSESPGTGRPATPAWIDHAIWQQIYPFGATGAPIRLEPDAPLTEPSAPARPDRLQSWFGYAVESGANGLSLGPIFASSTHGYDTTDYLCIDPRLGDDAAFDRLAEACRTRGLSLMLDGVLGYVGTECPLFRATRVEGEERSLPRFDDAFVGDGAGGSDAGSTGPGYATFEGHESLAVLNHDSAEMCDLAVQVLTHQPDRGASAWRLDAVYTVDPVLRASVLPAVRERHLDAWFMGEVIHGDCVGFVEASTMGTVTQYELWKVTWSSLADVNSYELDWCLKRHNELLDWFVPAIFVGNHDVTRIASKVGAGGAVFAVVLFMIVGGVPGVYYGDEQAFRGVKTKTLSGDDEVRPALPTTPSGLTPQEAWMLQLHQNLIGLRRRHPWSVRARTKVTELDSPRLFYDAVDEEGQWLHVSLALEPAPRAEVRTPGEEPLVVEPPTK